MNLVAGQFPSAGALQLQASEAHAVHWVRTAATCYDDEVATVTALSFALCRSQFVETRVRARLSPLDFGFRARQRLAARSAYPTRLVACV